MNQILIVDDKPENLYFLRALLKGHGYEVIEARHGAEALAKARQNPPHLVISDLLMPVMDGYTLLRHWKLDEQLNSIPFIVYTATYTEPKDERLALDLGADAFIVKPTEPDVFLVRLQELLAKQASGALSASSFPSGKDEVLLKQYNEVLIRRLEIKMEQLERTNRELERDIAERKRTEAALRRVDRALRTISECNQIMVHAKNETELLEQACRIMVEHGGYRFAWIGYADADIAKVVRPVAHAGFEAGYLDMVKMTCDESENGLGPTHTAIRTGRLHIVPDISQDPSWNLHRPEALDRGYASEIVLPLMDQNRAFGALNIFSSESNAFDPEEIRLLTELAEDLAFGVLSLRTSIQRQRAEEQLRLHSSALNAAANAIMIADHDGNIQWINPAWSALTGYAAAETLGKNPRILKSGNQEDAFYKNLWETITSGKVWRGELVNRRKDGSHYAEEATITPVADSGGRITHFIGIKQDITERQATQERVRAQAELLDLAQDAIIVRDMRGQVQYWNKGSERLTGWTAAEALGRLVTELLQPAGDAFKSATQALLDHGQWNGELKLAVKDGRTITVMSRWTQVNDKQGRPKSVLMINTDLTEQKRIESQFLRAQRMDSVGQLAAGVAHDLNNILAPILMAVPLLREEVVSQQNAYLLETIENSAQRGANVIKQLMVFARGKEGPRIPLSIRRLINEMTVIIRETFPKSIRLHTEFSQDLWAVPGDPTQLHQVLLNLCVNARDALPEGGLLALSAENIMLDDCFVRLMPEAKVGPHVILNVSDSGTGIAPEILDKVFDPFFTTKTPDKGTGLGLSTVLGIVKNHDGFIQIDSEVGRGTQFRIYLPAAPHQASTASEVQRPELPKGHGELILVVDDESSIRNVTGRTLEKHGYRVLIAKDGTEATALYTQHQGTIQLVLTDLMMPIMDGIATIRVLRGINSKLKIIAASGAASRSRLANVDDLPVQAFLQKPYTADILLNTVQQVLQGKETKKHTLTGPDI